MELVHRKMGGLDCAISLREVLMPRNPLDVKVSSVKRILRACRAEGEIPERVEFNGDHFSVVIARRDHTSSPRPVHEDLDVA